MIATTEEQRLLEKWQKKLCLQEWRIKPLCCCNRSSLLPFTATRRTAMKTEEKNLRRISIVVTAQTKGNLERLAAVCGYSEIGRVVDKLTREKMISLHDFERKEKHYE